MSPLLSSANSWCSTSALRSPARPLLLSVSKVAMPANFELPSAAANGTASPADKNTGALATKITAAATG
ncbi:hypothetical protein [Vibrio nigripulchritudo]|uniref:hypothetical protein n=1 Tax=Vibrio nigripulchritudo TaxID=28173 RepID=UPI0012DAC4BF|nr:hypothetical protein [Vibrio nigripulchritudo]